MADSTLKSRVQTEMIAAMKNGNKERTQVVRMLLSEIKRKESDDPGAKAGDAVAGYAKVLRKSMADMEKHGRMDHAEQIRGELVIVSEFLPKEMGDEELQALANEVLAPLGILGPKDMGKAIGLVMKAVAAKGAGADAGKVRSLVESKIQQ